jgi:hypothetical protein
MLVSHVHFKLLLKLGKFTQNYKKERGKELPLHLRSISCLFFFLLHSSAITQTTSPLSFHPPPLPPSLLEKRGRREEMVPYENRR